MAFPKLGRTFLLRELLLACAQVHRVRSGRTLAGGGCRGLSTELVLTPRC